MMAVSARLSGESRAGLCWRVRRLLGDSVRALEAADCSSDLGDSRCKLGPCSASLPSHESCSSESVIVPASVLSILLNCESCLVCASSSLVAVFAGSSSDLRRIEDVSEVSVMTVAWS